MADRELMPIEWLRYLKQRTDERDDEIVRNILQTPDYPPLPECPTCDVAPEGIASQSTGLGGEGVLVDFRPCGHGFRVPESELLRG